MLFVCARNRLRSPTAEALFADRSDLEVDSAGLNPDSEVLLSVEAVVWADLIFVMEKRHRSKLQQRFRRHLGGKRVVCLNIPDRYGLMEPALVELLRQRVTPHLRSAL